VFENRVLRRISGPRRDEVTGEWRKLHSEDLHDLYSSPSIIRIIMPRIKRWARLLEVLEGRQEGKGPPGKSWCRWMADNIKVHLTEMKWDGMD
jgi:hypothetical protein